MKQFISFVIKESKHISRTSVRCLFFSVCLSSAMLLFGFAITTDVRRMYTNCSGQKSQDYQTQNMITALRHKEYFGYHVQCQYPAEVERLIRDQKADIAIGFSQILQVKGGLQILADGADPIWLSNTAIMPPDYVSASDEQCSVCVTATLISAKLLYNPQMKSAYNFGPWYYGYVWCLFATLTSIGIVKEKGAQWKCCSSSHYVHIF